MLAQMRTGQGGEKPPAGLPALGSALLILLLVAPAFPQSPVPSEPGFTESATADPDVSMSGESPSGVTGERDTIACAWEARPADAKVARVLRERARRLAEERAWLEAGESAYGAAVLYPPCSGAVASFREVARYFHYADELERARLALISAAEHAVSIGDPAAAAHAYLDAAELAEALGDAGAAVLPIAAAVELTRSPELSRAERRDVVRRMELGARRAAEVRDSVRPAIRGGV